jgi:predicted amidohydrolase YtcJ
VEQFVSSLGLKPNSGDDWLKTGPLKITVDGGIHWGTTYLSEPYGDRRIQFYRLLDAQYRGDLRFSVPQMAEIFAAGHKLGWQMSCHITGDAGVDAVLDALAASHQVAPVSDRRFTLIHAYFPTPAAVARCRQLGVVVDTQSYLYYRDADTLADVYGHDWAERFIGLGEWVRGGVKTAINSDHMLGLDPNHAMNSFNPALALYIAVSRKTDSGKVYGSQQKLSREEALGAMTTSAAFLSFDEAKKGALEPGKLADLAVLDRDYFTCPEEEISQINVVLTVVGGSIVYQR